MGPLASALWWSLFWPSVRSQSELGAGEFVTHRAQTERFFMTDVGRVATWQTASACKEQSCQLRDLALMLRFGSGAAEPGPCGIICSAGSQSLGGSENKK